MNLPLSFTPVSANKKYNNDVEQKVYTPRFKGCYEEIKEQALFVSTLRNGVRALKIYMRTLRRTSKKQ